MKAIVLNLFKFGKVMICQYRYALRTILCY